MFEYEEFDIYITPENCLIAELNKLGLDRWQVISIQIMHNQNHYYIICMRLHKP